MGRVLPVFAVQVVVSLFVLHRHGVVALALTLLLLQLLLQPLLPAQLHQRQPIQVTLTDHVSVQVTGDGSLTGGGRGESWITHHEDA